MVEAEKVSPYCPTFKIQSKLIKQSNQAQAIRTWSCAVLEAEFTLVLKDNTLNGAKSPLSLEVSLNLECGLNGKWEIKHSSIKEVDCVSPSGVGPTQAVFRPNTHAKVSPLNPPQDHVFKPKPSLVW